MRWWLLLGLAGCDRVLGLGPVSGDGRPIDIAVGSGVDAANITCPPNYNMDSITGSRYRNGAGAGFDFVSAARFCASDTDGLMVTGHTHLAVVSNEIEREVLAAYSEYWIGITDVTSATHVWTWVSTEPMPLDPSANDTMLWVSGEPNNLDYEMCGYFEGGAAGHLNNTSCMDQRQYLCECDVYPDNAATYQ